MLNALFLFYICNVKLTKQIQTSKFIFQRSQKMTTQNLPYLVTERHFAGLINLIKATITISLKKKKHPVFLFDRIGNTQLLYIENDTEKLMITIERRRKPKPKQLTD